MADCSFCEPEDESVSQSVSQWSKVMATRVQATKSQSPNPHLRQAARNLRERLARMDRMLKRYPLA